MSVAIAAATAATPTAMWFLRSLDISCGISQYYMGPSINAVRIEAGRGGRQYLILQKVCVERERGLKSHKLCGYLIWMSPISVTRLFVLLSTTFTAHPLLDLGTENRQDAFLETCSHGRITRTHESGFHLFSVPSRAQRFTFIRRTEMRRHQSLREILGIE